MAKKNHSILPFVREIAVKMAFSSLLLALASTAYAHARLLPAGLLKPRSTSAGLKTGGACGGIPRGTSPTVLKAGSKIKVEWEETVNHVGSFRFAFSPANDMGFDQNVLATVPDTLGADKPLPHSYTVDLTVPSTLCESCTIQLIQIMMDVPASPSNYYSCADIRIVAGDAPTTTPVPEATPVPASTPVPGVTPVNAGSAESRATSAPNCK